MAAADQPVCQRHGRPAVASRVRLRPDGTQEVEYLCEIDLAEEQMSSRFGGRSLFDDFFSDFFGDGPSAGGGSTRAGPQRQVERVDVTQFFSDATRDLLQRAAQTAVEWGSLDLDSDHLLYAALQDDVVRHVLREIDADPEAITAEIEEEAAKAKRSDVSPSLTPDAKAALLAAYEESRELGDSYVGPEHVLLALARDDESQAGQLLQQFGIFHTKLRGAVIRGVEAGGTPADAILAPRWQVCVQTARSKARSFGSNRLRSITATGCGRRPSASLRSTASPACISSVSTGGSTRRSAARPRCRSSSMSADGLSAQRVT